MKKPKTATLVTLALLISWVTLILALYAAIIILSKGNDRLLIMLIGFAGVAAILIGRMVWDATAVYIPRGLVGVICQFGQRIDARPGPVALHPLPLLQHVDYFALLQKPLDLNSAFTTADQIQVEINLSIYYEITPGSVIPHLQKWIDIVGDINRLTKAWLTTNISGWNLDIVANRLPRFGPYLVGYLNNPANCLGHFSVTQTLYTEIKPPVDIILANTRQQVANTQSAVQLNNLRIEINERVRELGQMANSMKGVDEHTFEILKLHTLVDHLEEAFRGLYGHEPVRPQRPEHADRDPTNAAF